jgi:hypothetical protein
MVAEPDLYVQRALAHRWGNPQYQPLRGRGRAASTAGQACCTAGAAQPQLGLPDPAKACSARLVKLASNWVVSGSARWDLEPARSISIVGAGYVDDCFVLAANYVTSYTYSAGTTPPVLSHAFMLQIGLRTIATSSTTTSGAGAQY